MEDKYHHLWLLFRERMARRAGEAASTEKKEMYDWVLEETALRLIVLNPQYLRGRWQKDE